jgi:hypothetical protein
MKVEARPGIFRRGHLIEVSLCFRTVAIGSRQTFLTRIDSAMLVNRVAAQVQANFSFRELLFIRLTAHQ